MKIFFGRFISFLMGVSLLVGLILSGCGKDNPSTKALDWSQNLPESLSVNGSWSTSCFDYSISICIWPGVGPNVSDLPSRVSTPDSIPLPNREQGVIISFEFTLASAHEYDYVITRKNYHSRKCEGSSKESRVNDGRLVIGNIKPINNNALFEMDIISYRHYQDFDLLRLDKGETFFTMGERNGNVLKILGRNRIFGSGQFPENRPRFSDDLKPEDLIQLTQS